MGFANMFGLGKKKTKIPFKVPGAVSALRAGIEDENRENYPKLARYQEIVNSARVTYKQLDVIIEQAEYAEEATRIKEDLQKRMDRLTQKINANKREAGKEEGKDYVESNLAYLERKGRRNQAKTLFTECLDAFESIMTYYKGEHLKHGATIEAVTGDVVKAIATLKNDFFKVYGEDKEIKEIRAKLLEKIQDLNAFFKENKEGLKEKGLETKARSVLKEINESSLKLH